MLHRTSIANLIAQTQTEDLTCIGRGSAGSLGTLLSSCSALRCIFAPFIYKNKHFAKTGSGQA
jgi:hypothetical protein